MNQDGNEVALTEVGATFSSEGIIPFEVLDRKLYELVVVNRASRWGIADILNYAETYYGETYAQLEHRTGYTYGTLANLKSLGKRVPQWVRRPELGLSFHEAVSKFEPEEQDQWLKLAEENGWTRDELREAIALPAPEENQQAFSLLDVAQGILSAYDSGDREAMKEWIKMLRNILE